MIPVPKTQLTITTVGGIGEQSFNVSFYAKCYRRNITPASGNPTYNWIVTDEDGDIIDSNSYQGQGFMVFADNLAPYSGNLTFKILDASADMAFSVVLWYDAVIIAN